MLISKEVLENLYIKENRTRGEVCSLLDISCKKFSNLLKEYGIKKSRELVIAKITESNKKTWSKPETKQKLKDTFFKRFNASSPIGNPLIREKIVNTNLEKYGSISPFGNKEISRKAIANMKKTFSTGEPLRKLKETNFAKYGYTSSLFRPEIQKKIREGFESGKTQLKDYETKKKRNSFHISKPEEDVYQLLLTKFKKEEIKRNYREDPRYPYKVDFYITSLDLFIECQFSWVHGKPSKRISYGGFIPDNIQHQALLEKWKRLSQNKSKSLYKTAIETWTVRDVNKRKMARDNKLNYLEFFSYEEAVDYIKGNL